MQDLLEQLQTLSLAPSRHSLVKAKKYWFKPVPHESFKITSFNVKEQAYKSKAIPTMARGLFTHQVDGKEQVCIRGYNKFFNIGEVPQTTWPFLEKNTVGPYEMTLKENGCIIYISSVAGHLLVTSKHALGPIEGRVSHAKKGEEWVDRHLKQSGKTREELVAFLERERLTAVFELVDDDFEEHILEYSKEKSGLYVHGLNENNMDFISRPFKEVKAFGDTFGFWVVDCLSMDTIDQVKDFSSECSKTGSYNGTPIEGFVVRCKLAKSNFIHFFKIKFDEPYLMFREWREVTRVLLSGKYTPRYRFSLTERYITWVRAQMKHNPDLFKNFNQNKGIIYIRNLFLIKEFGINGYLGVDLSNFCKVQDLSNDTFGAEKCLIIPVATIGAGKTTLARTLTFLYPELFDHIQNDNIDKKNAAIVFEKNIMDAFEKRDIVIADRNNHLFQHREGLSTIFKSMYPGGKIIALDWGIENMDKKEVLDLTASRVESRGENHQSLTPQRCIDYKRILNQFIFHRDPLDQDSIADSKIDTIIELSIKEDVMKHIESITEILHLKVKSKETIEKAIDEAKKYKETFQKVVKIRNTRPFYYGVRISSDLSSLLVNAFLKQGKEEEWNKFSPAIANMSKKGFHSTICVRLKEKSELLEKFDHKWKLYKEHQNDPKDNLSITSPVSIKVSKVYWDDNVITILIDDATPQYESTNFKRHITVGLLHKDAKASQSNILMEKLNENTTKSLSLGNCIIHGKIDGFLN